MDFQYATLSRSDKLLSLSIALEFLRIDIGQDFWMVLRLRELMNSVRSDLVLDYASWIVVYMRTFQKEDMFDIAEVALYVSLTPSERIKLPYQIVSHVNRISDVYDAEAQKLLGILEIELPLKSMP